MIFHLCFCLPFFSSTVLFFEKKSRHHSFLREEKKAKEALVIVLCKSYNEQTEMTFHLCFCFDRTFL